MFFDIQFSRQLKTKSRVFDLSVSLKSSEKKMAILGPSGAGKTQTLNHISGLARPDKGHISIGGHVFFDSDKKINLDIPSRKVGLVLQDHALFPHLTVRQNICFGLKHGVLNPSRHFEIDQLDYWLKQLNLREVTDQYPASLSGGQKQRVSMARALIIQPQLLLLDEPFCALDYQLKNRLRTELATLLSDLDLPMILITHDEEDVAYFGGKKIYIENGVINQK